MSFHQHSQKSQALCGLLSLILPDRIARRIHPSTPPILIDSDGLSGSRATHRVSSCDERRVTINILPDDVLLHIFLVDGLDYQYQHETTWSSIFGREADFDRMYRLPWTWHRLIHVCKRWRSIVFASPNFLDLRLVCGSKTRMELIGIWPPLPIIVTTMFYSHWYIPCDYNFVAAIVHRNRVREISLSSLSKSQLQRLASAAQMQKPFPALTHLLLTCCDHRTDPAPALPDGFLGCSAPRLQSLVLDSISFHGLPKLLLSATHLVRLILYGIPHSGYFSPEAIVTGLAVMANLKYLTIEFDSPLSLPHERRRRPPPTRTVLPALTRFKFKGASEYLEDFVARIDTHLLDSIYITFFHQLIFDIPRLAQFMGRTTRFQKLKEAHVKFDRHSVYVQTHSPTRTLDEIFGFQISCEGLDWQLSSLAQVFASFFPSIYMVEHLYIYEPQYNRQDDIENMQWLEFFHPFTAVKNLYLSKRLAPFVAPALQELVGGRTTEVLSTLQNINLEGLHRLGLIPEGVGKFVAARQFSNYPINVSHWQRDWHISELDGSKGAWRWTSIQ